MRQRRREWEKGDNSRAAASLTRMRTTHRRRIQERDHNLTLMRFHLFIDRETRHAPLQPEQALCTWTCTCWRTEQCVL